MRPATLLALTLLAITLGLVVIVVYFGVRTIGIPMAPGQPPLLEQLPFYVPILFAFTGVGALVAVKRPRNPIGWLFAATAVIFAFSLATGGYVAEVTAFGSPAERAFVEAQNQDPLGLAIVLFGFILLLYPTGRLPSRRWIPVAIFCVAAATVGAIYTGPGHELFGLALPLAITAPFVRLRHASPVERRQIEWFVYFLALTVAAFILSILVGFVDDNVAGFFWGAAAFCAGMTAVAAGVAIMRYRLYDIDVLIRRTAVYGATTIVLAVTFFAIVLVVQALLSPFTRGNELAVAASTLASVGLFQPLRRRIQSVVDRRFYRSQYDAARTLDEFSTRLRDEVDLDTVRADLVDVVASTVQPAHASVWLRVGGK